jgi:hypothetical protein
MLFKNYNKFMDIRFCHSCLCIYNIIGRIFTILEPLIEWLVCKGCNCRCSRDIKE